MAKEKPTYTTILHQSRKKLKISLLEYCLCDSIHKLSGKPEFPWCSASKQELATFLGISRRSATAIIKKMLNRELIEKDPETKFLRTTSKWITAVETNGRAKFAQGGKKVPTGREESSHRREESSHNNKSINKNNKSLSGKPTHWDLKEEREKLVKDQKRHIQIVGLWIKERDLQPENAEQMQSLIKRNLRPARLLNGYSNEDIQETIKVLKNTDYLRKFTLETVAKYIDEIVAQKEKRGPKIIRYEEIRKPSGNVVMRPIYEK
jgi:DNA-binding MarR family transcriptional regulator